MYYTGNICSLHTDNLCFIHGRFVFYTRKICSLGKVHSTGLSTEKAMLIHTFSTKIVDNCVFINQCSEFYVVLNLYYIVDLYFKYNYTPINNINQHSYIRIRYITNSYEKLIINKNTL